MIVIDIDTCAASTEKLNCLFVITFEFQEIQQLELLCKHLYESNDQVQRAEAEKALVNFQVGCTPPF